MASTPRVDGSQVFVYRLDSSPPVLACCCDSFLFMVGRSVGPGSEKMRKKSSISQLPVGSEVKTQIIEFFLYTILLKNQRKNMSQTKTCFVFLPPNRMNTGDSFFICIHYILAWILMMPNTRAWCLFFSFVIQFYLVFICIQEYKAIQIMI